MLRHVNALGVTRAISLAILGLLAFAASGFAPVRAADIGLTIDGVPFAAARGEVINERLVDVEGSSVVLALWDERVDGRFAPHAGISLDGRTLVRVTPVSYELGFRYDRFDPLERVPDIRAELQAPAESRLFLVQFITQPLEIFTEQIAARGGTVRQYVAQYAYLVEADPAAMDAISELPYVRWVGAYHPAYRLEEFMVDNLDRAHELFPSQAYNVRVLDVDQKMTLATRVQTIGGQIQTADAGKHLVEVVLTPQQLLAVSRWDEVLFVDRWGPYESDMDIGREIGGANYIAFAGGYQGQGVRGEIFDSEFNLNHVDFASRPLIVHGGSVSTGTHGASCSGINFGDGTGNPNGMGLMPRGQGIVADSGNIGQSGPSRYNHSAELLQPPYQAVFQTSSVGSPRTTQYTNISADHDEILFDFDISFCQSQSNAGDRMSRPQAWAKNIISGGGVYHQNTLSRDDDCWCSGASIGPASDGRIKPTFTHFYDRIFTVTCCGAESYTTNFGGTSGATPIICGHVGLFYEMWADGIFGNPVNEFVSVFENRSHMTTAKAMLINTAEQYDFSGTSGDLTRVHQGWGMPNLQNLYDLRDQILVIDETDVLEPFESTSYVVEVEEGAPYLKVTMTYADPAGNPGVQSQHRVNDVDLVVTSPLGGTYYGNVGLMAGTFSSPGGQRDTKNTVENVFVESPQAGLWTIEVEAVELIQDGHVETPELDVDYALVASPVGFDIVSTGSPAEEIAPAGLEFAIVSMGPTVAEARMTFQLPGALPVRLNVYDVNGRLVASVVNAVLPGGSHSVSWPGIDDSGNAVQAGVYFARLEAGSQAMSGKVLVVR